MEGLSYIFVFNLLKIGGAFLNKLVDENDIVGFDFVKSIGQNICPLNLHANKAPSGENIFASRVPFM